jgi:hypothetical protein
MIRIALIVVLLVGCKIKNDLSCEDPDNMDLSHCSGVDAPEACSNADMSCSAGVCKLPEGVCVDCVENVHCPAATPVCNTATNTCERCDAHSDCASNACDISNGTCALESEVAYVVQGGAATTMCLRTDPCGDLTSAVNTDLPFIKFNEANATVDVTTGQTVDHDVTILAEPGAKLRRITTTGPILSIPSDCNVTIQDLEIREASSSTGHGIAVTSANVTLKLERVLLLDNNGRGLDMTAGDKLTMRRCIVSGNDDGGISLSDVDFDISNTLIVRNNGTAVGGFRTTGLGNNSVFRFNTVADNNATDLAQSGVNCDSVFTANSNIVTDNGLDPTCRFDFSLFDVVLPAMGSNNRVGEPDFDSTDPTKAREPKYYRLKNNSEAIDRADPNATEETDIDGQARPNPAGTVRDMGADELDP